MIISRAPEVMSGKVVGIGDKLRQQPRTTVHLEGFHAQYPDVPR